MMEVPAIPPSYLPSSAFSVCGNFPLESRVDDLFSRDDGARQRDAVRRQFTL
jgi:hypothetical protein